MSHAPDLRKAYAFIDQFQTRKGGFGAKGLSALGIPWPPYSGWRKSLAKRLAMGAANPPGWSEFVWAPPPDDGDVPLTDAIADAAEREYLAKTKILVARMPDGYDRDRAISFLRRQFGIEIDQGGQWRKAALNQPYDSHFDAVIR